MFFFDATSFRSSLACEWSFSSLAAKDFTSAFDAFSCASFASATSAMPPSAAFFTNVASAPVTAVA